MENGDLALWNDNRVVVVLEGVLAQIPPPSTHKSGMLHRKTAVEWSTPDHWVWSTQAIKYVNDRAYRYSSPVDVVTFTAPEVADMAADWLNLYEVQVSACEFTEFELFTASLAWRPNVHSVVDSVPDRLDHYGIRAYETKWGGIF